MLIANSAALLLTGLLGYLTFRRIVRPIQALETSVKTIAAGDYAKEVPFTQATDETGGLARSVDVLKQGAAAMDEQRWVKSNAAKSPARLQGATSLAEFGQRLRFRPGAAAGRRRCGLLSAEGSPARLRRIAAYGLAEGAALARFFGLGEGLVGQCAQERKPVTAGPACRRTICASPRAWAAARPCRPSRSPLLPGTRCWACSSSLRFRAFNSQEKALLEELLPVVAMSLEVLQRNLRTQELLAQTQEQARQLEEQTEELTQSQEELLRRKKSC